MSKSYKKFVEDEIIKSIAEKFDVTKNDAKELYVDALSRNLVVAEILDMVQFLLDEHILDEK